jgi:hypothetical protein
VVLIIANCYKRHITAIEGILVSDMLNVYTDCHQIMTAMKLIPIVPAGFDSISEP